MDFYIRDSFCTQYSREYLNVSSFSQWILWNWSNWPSPFRWEMLPFVPNRSQSSPFVPIRSHLGTIGDVWGQKWERAMWFIAYLWSLLKILRGKWLKQMHNYWIMFFGDTMEVYTSKNKRSHSEDFWTSFEIFCSEIGLQNHFKYDANVSNHTYT